jgi:hypothetical protein
MGSKVSGFGMKLKLYFHGLLVRDHFLEGIYCVALRVITAYFEMNAKSCQVGDLQFENRCG